MKRVTLTLFFIALAFGSLSGPFVHAQEAQTAQELLQRVLDQLNNPTSTQSSVASGFSRDGVYGCTGASYGSVGAQGPSGSHVPVFDSAVHDQERLLTYKECLLDGIYNANREALVADIIRRTVTWANTGFDGNPAYITNLPLHMLENVSDPEAERIITGPETEVIAAPFRRDVRVALAKTYSQETRAPENALRCNVSDTQLTSMRSGDFYAGGGWESFFNLATNTSCNPLFAYFNARNRLQDSITTKRTEEQEQLNWGSGIRPLTVNKTVDLGDGATTTVSRVVTPGFMIAENLQSAIGAGLRQTENADEIDEIVAALMSHIGVQTVSGTNGFAGLAESISGESSYLDRLVQDSSARARNNMTGAAASIVNNTVRIEQEFVKARQSAVSSLNKSQRQLETWEMTCWDGIVAQAKDDLKERVQNRVCSGRGNNTCSTPVTVTAKTAPDAIVAKTVSDGKITVSGRISQNNSTVDVIATGSGVTVGPTRPTVSADGTWVTGSIDLTTIPDGTVTVSATETLANGSGTFAPASVTLAKETSVAGITLTLPIELPSVTVTATAQNVTESATIVRSMEHSRSIVDSAITPLLTIMREEIARSIQALEVLERIKADLSATVSASGQRFILERIDELIAARVLHTEAQLRQALEHVDEIEALMKKLLEDTREEWEGGWCNPDNWEQHTGT